MKRCLAILAALIVSCATLAAELAYKDLDLGKDDSLLFSTETEIPGDASYDTLFAADLGGTAVAQLSVYPERISLVDGGSRLQVQNRYGLFRSDTALTGLAPVPGFPAFERGSALRQGKLLPSAESPDGAFVLSLKPSSPAYAKLVLFDVAQGTETVVAAQVEYSIESMPARWSPDSRNFAYAKDGSIYYYSIDQVREHRVLDEADRRIGDGRIRCVRWAPDGSLFYVKGNALFRILPAEFFTQALYRGFAGMGELAGKTAFDFDPNFDDFWVSKDANRIVLSKGGRNLFLIYLNPDDYGASQRVSALPYLYLQGNTVVRDVIWPASGDITVFTGSLKGSDRSSGAYRLSAPADPAALGLQSGAQELKADGAEELVLSPDESSIAVVTPDGVSIRYYADWSPRYEIKAPGALHALWLSDDRLVVAGRSLIEAVSVPSGQRSLLALSQVQKFGRSEDGNFYAQVGNSTFKRPAMASASIAAASTDPLSTGLWTASSAFPVQSAATSSANYRVYLDSIAPCPYRNELMVRSIKALGTRPLFPPPVTSYVAFPDKDESRASPAFDHGSRIRRREVALVFDAVDSAEGLVSSLNTLKDYGLKASFFVNGDFVRQSPGAARLLAESGNEIGSMFFSSVDTSDARFKIDSAYIRRGLARAEDDWFGATGKELSLLWHTPYYTVNSDIIAAGISMNYTFVGRDIDPMDWMARADAAKLPGSYLDAHKMIESIAAKAKPGSIIPIRLGIPDGGRDDYLYEELALLIDALEAEGFAIVPVSTLIAHAN